MIELKNIYKTYSTGKVAVHALTDVSLKIEAGEFVSIMGSSGSGKSTLLHILGFLDKPNSGTYLLNNHDITRFSDSELAGLRNQIAGFVFQQFHLLSRMTAWENVALPLLYSGSINRKNLAMKRIEQVGLGARALHQPNELSGGEQQRVAIARALSNNPILLFADEPTGNLDSKRKDEIMAILQDLNRQGITIVMVTHEPEVAQKTKRIITVRDGVIVSDCATISEKIQTPQLDLSPISQFPSMHWTDHIRQAFGAIWSHKLRSCLSMLGILIGVMAVITMLALGEGAKQSISQSLASLGTNLLVVRPGSHQMHGVALEAGAVTRFTLEDSESIAQIESIKGTSASVQGRAQIVYQNKNTNTQVQGTEIGYAFMRASLPVVGRFFSKSELISRAKVAVIGKTVANALFENSDPIGKEIKINRIAFRVIGLLPEKGATGFRDQDDLVVIPITTAMYRLLGKEYIDGIDVEVRDAAEMEAAQEAIRQLIIKRKKLSSDKADSFEIRNMADIQKTMETTTKTMSMLLGFIAMISLIVGGIGIMNIMLVSVTERTREIGLRKALGAKNSDILIQFLIESVVLTLLGGILGIVLGSGISMLLSSVANWTTHVSWFSVVLAVGFSAGVGVVFGLWPAKQAAKMNLVEALRYE